MSCQSVDFIRCSGALHLSDNSAQVPHGQSGHDRLFMVRKLFDLVVQRFEPEYVIKQDCTNKEAMISFRGRPGFKHYLRDNPQNGSKYLYWLMPQRVHQNFLNIYGKDSRV